MKQKTKRNIKKNIANFFGFFGYLFCFLQWFWVVMLYFSVIKSATLFISSNADRPVEHRPGFAFALPSQLEMIILAIVVVVMIAITVYVLIKIPMSIVKTGNKVVHRTAETMTPVIIRAQHKEDTKKVHSRITSKLILVVKLLVIIIPVIMTAASGLLEKQSISYSIALIVGSGLAGLSVVLFAIQYSLASLFRVKMRELW